MTVPNIPNAKQRILLAVDSGTYQKLTEKILIEWGFDTDIAPDGRQAIEKIILNNYDLCLISLVLPIIDGYAVTTKIRLELKKTMPIIGMTSWPLDQVEAKCAEVGMNEVIQTPDRPQVLRDKIKDWLKRDAKVLLMDKSPHLKPPPIKDFMTVPPLLIDRNDTAEKAQKLMKEHNIRHLPVMDGDTIEGILSDRDLKLAHGLRVADAGRLKVYDICTLNPYKVDLETPIDEVAREMARKRYGSAIVTKHAKIVGMFTTVDACKAISEILLLQQTQ